MKPFEVQIERVVYGGFGLARSSGADADLQPSASFVPFTLPGELVEAMPSGVKNELKLLRVSEASKERVQPGCPHFGVCGGCHLQMASYGEQLRIKEEVLRESLTRAGVMDLPDIATHAAEPWHYRNRIRLHVTHDDRIRFGYRERASDSILPITTCPIAAPLLWRTAEAMMNAAPADGNIRRWLESSVEVELFCNADMSRLQIALLCPNSRTPPVAHFQKMFD